LNRRLDLPALMAPTRRQWLAAIAGSTALAGCIGDDGDDDDDGSDDGTSDSGADDGTTDSGTDDGMEDSTGPGGDGGPELSTTTHDEYGEIVVDGDGMALYMFDSDEQGAGASTCSGGCAENWPPLTTDGGVPSTDSAVSADVSTFQREDGSAQVAADGWPLYYWQGDSEPGAATGQGVNDVWWLLRPDGTPVRPDVRVAEHDQHGEILVDGEGMTLYMFDSDEQGAGASTCSGGCASAWPPLTTGAEPVVGADVAADVSSFTREDTDTQLVANGWPLYYYAQDAEAGDAAGQGANEVWWVLDPDGEPIRD